mgnify:CR=1 FL=1
MLAVFKEAEALLFKHKIKKLSVSPETVHTIDSLSASHIISYDQGTIKVYNNYWHKRVYTA